MHAYLVIGQDKEQRNKKVTEIIGGKSEVITLATDGKHTIDSVRRLKSNLSLAPANYEEGRIVVIHEAQLFTQEAANAFLKTLEEPVGKTIFILTAPIAELVIDTIISRCQLINLGRNSQPTLDDTSPLSAQAPFVVFQNLINSQTVARLAVVDGIKDREEGLNFCREQAWVARKKMLDSPSLSLANLLERIEVTKADLEANVNVKLALADLVLNYPKGF